MQCLTALPPGVASVSHTRGTVIYYLRAKLVGLFFIVLGDD